MPHSASAKKRVRQNEKHRARNRAIKSRIRTAERAFMTAVEQGDAEASRLRLRECVKLIHRAADNGPMHRNTAARKVSRLQRTFTEMEATPE
jgi:small subunit ribosomal protein S20